MVNSSSHLKLNLIHSKIQLTKKSDLNVKNAFGKRKKVNRKYGKAPPAPRTWPCQLGWSITGYVSRPTPTGMVTLTWSLWCSCSVHINYFKLIPLWEPHTPPSIRWSMGLVPPLLPIFLAQVNPIQIIWNPWRCWRKQLLGNFNLLG